MKNSLYKTGNLLLSLLKRDRFKLILWILGLIAFAASGAGKMEIASTPATKASLYLMFVKNPAMVALFGPTLIKNPAAYSLGPIYGQAMTLITCLTFAIVSIIYVINRTRKEEDDGVLELFCSYSIGKLANTSAVVLTVLILHLLLAFLLAFSIQVQNVAGLNHLPSNLLFASACASQGFLWGMIALFLAQIFPEASTAKGATFGLLGIFYVLRMGTDISNLRLSWFNPLSWGYLSFPYLKNHENWCAVGLALILAVIFLGLSYILEQQRDMRAGYLPERKGRQKTRKALLSLPGLVFYLQKRLIFSALLGLFVLGLVYGAMFGQMDQFIRSNATIRQIFVGTAQAHQAIVGQFMVTLFSIMSILVAAFAVVVLSRLSAEERKNRQEQLYAFPISRFKMYWTYLILAVISAVVGQFLSILGIYLEQLQQASSLSFSEIFKSGMIWLVGIIFVLALTSLLVAILPRFVGVIWLYLAFLLFESYLGNLLRLPKILENLSIYKAIPKLPVEDMNWGSVSLILLISLLLFAIAAIAYRRRDLVNG